MPLPQWMTDFSAKAKSTMSQYNNATFKNAVLSVCALMAAADGDVEPEEKSKVASLIAGNDLLSVFAPSDLKATFEVMCAKAVDDFQRIELINHVRQLKGDQTAAHTAIGIAMVIANADGEFEEAEKKVVRELCGVLVLPADSYLS